MGDISTSLTRGFIQVFTYIGVSAAVAAVIGGFVGYLLYTRS